MARICVLATLGRCIFEYQTEGWPHCWPEFGEAAGHILHISEGVYGLRNSGARYHEKIADNVWQLGWFPYWRGYLDFWEEHTSWVLLDDLLYDGHDPIRFFKKLIDMKCVCPPTYTLGKTSSAWRTTRPRFNGFQEVEYCGDRNIWIRLCGRMNCNRPDCGFEPHITSFRCTCGWYILNVSWKYEFHQVRHSGSNILAFYHLHEAMTANII